MTETTPELWTASMPEAYDEHLAPVVFRPFAAELARRVEATAPTRLLEVAAGTGVLTRALVDTVPDGTVTATDLNPAMVDFGSRRVPEAAWRQADALDLPFDDDRFDVVACQFGVMFFPDKVRAFREARRVLAPGGRVVFSTWGPVHTHAFGAALLAGLERAFPHDPPTGAVTVAHGYSDLDAFVHDLAAGGLDLVESDTVTLEGRAPSAEDVAVGFCAGTPVRTNIAECGDVSEVTSIIADEMRVRLGDGPVTGSMTAHIVEARARS